MEHSDDKSQEATPHRRQEARQKGQVAQSQDLTSAVTLLGGLSAILLFGGAVVAYMASLAGRQFAGEGWNVVSYGPDGFVEQFETVTGEIAVAVLPILAALLAVAVVSSLLQVGLLWVPDRLAPDITRLDPIKGLGRIFSLSSLVKLLLGLMKIGVIVAVAYFSLYSRREEILALAGLDLLQVASYLCEVLLWTGLKIGGALLVLGVLDFVYQRWKHEQDLRMSVQEIREEMKNLQGDPQVAARRRHVQRQLALSRLSKTVPKADVVVTNPTELAIAIQYDPETMLAPIVLAKGAGVLAQRIRRLALENHIPIVERKPLAQALYKEVEVNHPIGDQQYAAVAEVLAYVYRLKGKAIPGAPPEGSSSEK